MARLLTAAVVTMMLTSGCVDSEWVLHVSPDGHGRAVMTTRVYESGLRAFDQLFPGSFKPTTIEQELPPPDEGAVSQHFGTRVKVASSRFQKTGDGAVRTTIVEFEDVTALRISFPPPVQMAASGWLGIGGGLSDRPLMTFALKPHDNGDRLLVVKLPDERVEPDPNPQVTEFKTDSPEERALKAAVAKMALRFAIELDGVPLLRSNAPAVKGNRAVLLDLDLEKIVNGMDDAKARRAVAPGSMQELIWQLGDMPGATLPTDHEVFLEFEAPKPPQAAAPQARPAQAPPDTEIYLAPLKIANGRIDVGPAENITNSPGYDNQPSFTPDGRAVLFTSAKKGDSPLFSASAPVQTDIYRYDIGSRAMTRITDTAESEYSPTVMPDGSRISVVRVEADGTQRLWAVTPGGPTRFDVLLPDVKPVGYHAWADDHTLALFVLGQPATLQLADTRTGTARTIAPDIGRSLQRMPGSSDPRDISFVQRETADGGTRLVIKKLHVATGEVSVLTPAVDGSTEADLAWTPDGTLLMVHGDTLFGWRAGQSGWTAITTLQRLSLKGVTRLAVSPKGDFLALVGSPR